MNPPFGKNILCFSFQRTQYFNIRRTKRISINLVYCDPMDIIMLQFLGNTLPDGSMKQRQMDCQIGVFVDNIHEHLTHIQRNDQFFLAFPDECLLFCFAWFNLCRQRTPKEVLWPYGPSADKS